MAVNTMDAIKKKMQVMKLDKENAFDKADQLEQKLNEQKTVFEKVCLLLSALFIISPNATAAGYHLEYRKCPFLPSRPTDYPNYF